MSLEELEKYINKYYTGTHKLNLNEFPNVYGAIFPDRYSNIYTGYDTYSDEMGNVTDYILYPQMHKGEVLDTQAKVDRLIDSGLHFGHYKTQEEVDEMDKVIHSYFEKQSMIPKPNSEPHAKNPVSTSPPEVSPSKTGSSQFAPGRFKTIMDQVLEKDVFDHPVAQDLDIKDYRTLDRSDLSASDKFQLLKLASRHGELDL